MNRYLDLHTRHLLCGALPHQSQSSLAANLTILDRYSLQQLWAGPACFDSDLRKGLGVPWRGNAAIEWCGTWLLESGLLIETF